MTGLFGLFIRAVRYYTTNKASAIASRARGADSAYEGGADARRLA